MIGVSILGSTGSIGVNTLDVIARQAERFYVVGLSANRDVERLHEQCLRWRPRFAVMADPRAARELEERLRAQCPETAVLTGNEGLETIAKAPEAAYVMAAIVGAAGLLPTLAAAQAGKRVLLANKEALVMSGMIFMDAVRDNGAELLPIDSEHNAIFQCLPPGFSAGLAQVGVSRILITASGGPFRTLPLEQLHEVTPSQACAHPNWVMGQKISVDSATMMNKGLEVIEAHWLFGAAQSQIEVVLHPQSVIHSLVQYVDGSVLAQLGNPDMRTPIAHALAWPERMASGVEPLDLFAVARLDFERPDLNRFPCLRLAQEALASGGTATTILNAANEEAVAAFLDRRLRYTDIVRVIQNTLEAVPTGPAASLDAILEADAQARRWSQQAVMKLAA